jgi:hypothetical protein
MHERCAVGEDGLAATLRQRWHLLAGQDSPALGVDDACRDFGAADIDPNDGRLGKAPGAVQNAAPTAL